MNILLIVLCICTVWVQRPPVNLDNVPFLISECLQKEADRIEVSRRINPFYLRGDFNGDGLLDYVVLVQNRNSKKQGFAFCFAGTKKKVEIAGAGTAIALEGGVLRDDLSAFDLWGVVEARSEKPKRDALYVARAESGSGMLIWHGARIVWRQGGI